MSLDMTKYVNIVSVHALCSLYGANGLRFSLDRTIARSDNYHVMRRYARGEIFITSSDKSVAGATG